MDNIVPKQYLLIRNIITFLDITLALLIIVSANIIIDTSLGKVVLIFGLSMLIIITVLNIFRKF